MFALVFLAATFLAVLLLSAGLSQPVFAGLIGEYPFDEGTANDISGNGNNGTNHGATFVSPGYRAGDPGAFMFTSFASVTLPTTIDPTPSVLPQITFGGWFNPASASTVSGLISSDNGGFDRTIGIDGRGSGGLYTWSAFTGSGVVSSGVVPTLNAWTFVAVAYNQATNSGDLYVGRVGVDLTTSGTHFTTAFDADTVGFLDIAINPTFTNEIFTGMIDDAFVNDSFLTQAQINSIFQNGLPGLAPSAVPEPGSLALVGVAALQIGFFALRRRKRVVPASAASDRPPEQSPADSFGGSR
jgi:hypothetical protein